jgi:hypothetical protein
LQRYSTSTRLSSSYARFLIARKETSQAITALCRFALQFLQEKNPVVKSYISSQSNLTDDIKFQVNEIYCTLLKLPARPLLLSNSISADIYLWENYITFHLLTSTIEDQKEAVENALSRVSDKLERETIWQMYYQLLSKHSSEDELVQFLNRVVSDIPPKLLDPFAEENHPLLHDKRLTGIRVTTSEKVCS